ncbi:MAG: GTPase HflX [Treponema sp.]|jgi:GTP-binding protein HflX|nr:GTPase HflX [Treponema sp.]
MANKTYDTEEARKRALLVSFASGEDGGKELRGLAETLELDAVSLEIINIRERNPKFGMGSGKAAELAEKAAALKADCIVFDWDISPSQQRNWEELASIPVLDRQELIIQIFSTRAATREAELQVRLAELHYRLPRLAHKYIDLSRQHGGRYGTRGSGETRLETDRRLIEQRIHKLEKEIEEVSKQRQVRRRQRDRQGLPVCAIVGYTNAGKSSLLNALTGASVLAEDKLFATLDATTRRFEPSAGAPVLLIDTVGFIRRLPHQLIKAFRSTLEEAVLSNLLIHLIDASDAFAEECYKTTISVLRELGAGEIPVITALNKIDKLEDPADAEGKFPGSITISVKTGYGLDKLKILIAEKITANIHE